MTAGLQLCILKYMCLCWPKYGLKDAGAKDYKLIIHNCVNEYEQVCTGSIHSVLSQDLLSLLLTFKENIQNWSIGLENSVSHCSHDGIYDKVLLSYYANNIFNCLALPVLVYILYHSTLFVTFYVQRWTT